MDFSASFSCLGEETRFNYRPVAHWQCRVVFPGKQLINQPVMMGLQMKASLVIARDGLTSLSPSIKAQTSISQYNRVWWEHIGPFGDGSWVEIAPCGALCPLPEPLKCQIISFNEIKMEKMSHPAQDTPGAGKQEPR